MTIDGNIFMVPLALAIGGFHATATRECIAYSDLQKRKTGYDNTICTCPRCKQDFMLGLGVVIRTHYFKNNVEHFGWLAFHDLQCATLWLPAINTLPA